MFQHLSIEENLIAGFLPGRGKARAELFDEVYALFPILGERHRQAASRLSGGQQQMLAIGRAMMARPACLLLDEPSMGLAPILVAQILDVVKYLKSLGVTVLLVEQNAYAALQIADRGYVMETGRIAMAGPAAELIADERIRAAYLGL